MSAARSSAGWPPPFGADGSLLDEGHTAQLEAALEALGLEIERNAEGALATAA